MDIGALFLLLALLILISLYVARPLMERQPGVIREDRTRSTLLAERERLLTALQELDFDNTLGKVPAEEYPAQRAILLQRGAAILRQIDALQDASAGGAERHLEVAVATPRLEPKASSHPADADDIEDLVAKRRSSRQDKGAGFCPKCGKPILQSDAFCPSCGKPLK